MDVGFHLSLIAFLGGIWIYLLSIIQDLTLRQPTYQGLLFLGYVHFIVFVYLVSALYVFYRKSLSSLGGSPANKARVCLIERILFRTWPSILVFLGIAFVSTKLNFRDAYKAYLVIFALFTLALEVWLNKLYGKKMGTWKFVGFLIAPMIASYTYLIFMGACFADVEIATDKEFYQRDEAVMVSVRSGGYILRPSISKIVCGAFETTAMGEDTFRIPPDKHFGATFILVNFEPEVIPLKLRKTHDLKMVREETKELQK